MRMEGKEKNKEPPANRSSTSLRRSVLSIRSEALAPTKMKGFK